ncbi:hypothetical protein [Neobacillus sp. LXY-4]|uniref:hypothetical protein n=1 Tax=Neobacillus sp. LXY-4 TaxID=3379826 RepID=UPI003EE0A491
MTHPFTRNLGLLTVNESIITKAKNRSLTVTWLILLAVLALWTLWIGNLVIG